MIDASILVAGLLRQRGRDLLRNHMLELYIAEQIWAEARHELRRRVDIMVRQGRMPAATSIETIEDAFALVESRVAHLPAALYSHFQATAYDRIPRDPDDWHSVALALALDAGIWTQDHDFLGCGPPTWTTETLMAHPASQQRQ